MKRRYLLVASLLVLPSLAVAQRGGGGGGGRSRATEHDKMFSDDKDAPKGPTLRTRDLEDFSPIRMLIDKRKDLKQSDAQVDGLKKAEEPLKQNNEPLMKALDSLVREMKPPMNMNDEARSRIRSAGMALHETLQSIGANYDAAAKEALAGFDAEQHTNAYEMLAKR